MLKIGRKVEYGLMALKHMLGKHKTALTPVSEICQRFSTPFDPMAHVMRLLNARGLLASAQGTKGGYRLNHGVGRLSLAEFIEIINGKLTLIDCVGKQSGEKACCFAAQCNIVGPMQAINTRLNAFLHSINLQELLLETPAVDLAQNPHHPAAPTLSFSSLSRPESESA